MSTQAFTSPPPPQRPLQAPSHSNSLLRRFLRNEQVMVNITARGWVVGVVIAVLQTFDSLAGLRYKISFPSGDGQGSPQVGEFPHDPAYVRPK